MAKKNDPYFVERRPDGKYAVERADAERASRLLDTQKEAKDWARDRTDGAVHVARVRHTDGGSPDKWRKD